MIDKMIRKMGSKINCDLPEWRRGEERGTATLEFTFVASIYLTMMVGIVAGGTIFWAHNSLMDATRRGARYAASQCNPCSSCCTGNSTALTRIKNVVVFGTDNPPNGARPIVPGLTTSNVKVEYYNDTTFTSAPFGLATGTVAVSICQSAQNNYTASTCPGGASTTDSCTAYRYNYVFSTSSNLIQMPQYRTTLTGENAGFTQTNNTAAY